MGKKGGKQVRWTKPVEHLMLKILAEEVQMGHRPTNVFQTKSFARVATSITEKYRINCEPKHVENHLRTVRGSWNIIEKLRNTSGLGWDESMKMITASPTVYNEHVQENPNHEDYLNKKIEMYEELALVIRKDRARGDCVKSFLDVDLEANPDFESISLDNEINVEDEPNASEVPNASNSSTSSLPTTSSQARQHRKRSRKNFDAEKQMENMAEKIGAIAEALGRMSDNQLDMKKLVKLSENEKEKEMPSPKN